MEISEHPPRTNSRNFHSHLRIGTTYEPLRSNQGSDHLAQGVRFRWLPSMWQAWRTHTSSAGFVAGLRALASHPELGPDQLNELLEGYLLA